MDWRTDNQNFLEGSVYLRDSKSYQQDAVIFLETGFMAGWKLL